MIQLPNSDVPDLEFAGIKAQYEALKGDIGARLSDVFQHGRFIMGPEIAELETALAAYCGIEHAITVSSGTDALTASMMALGIGPGDAVFLPSFTFTATAEVVLLLGAAPVFVDVDPATFNIDLPGLSDKIEAVRKEGHLTPRAIVPVDLFGLPVDYAALNALSAAQGLYVISDAAQSFGGSQDDTRVGALAAITATSFFPAKPLGCYGDGGAVFTDDAELAAQIRSIRVHGQGAEKYAIDRVGLNARLDTIQAAILLAKLPALDGEIEARNRLAGHYDEHLSGICQTPRRSNQATSAFAQYSIVVDNRDEVQARLREADIPTAIYYPRPMHFQPPYAAFGDGAGSLPVSERLSASILSLPMHGYMTDDVAHRIGDAVKTAITA